MGKGQKTNRITKGQYEYALARIEELIPLVNDDTPATDRYVIALTLMSDIVIEYEKVHYPIGITPAAMLGT